MKYLKLFEQFINEARAPKELPLINKIFGDPGDPKDVPGGKKTYSSYIENIEKQLRSQLPSDFKNLWLNSVDLLTTKKAFTNLGNCSFTSADGKWNNQYVRFYIDNDLNVSNVVPVPHSQINNTYFPRQYGKSKQVFFDSHTSYKLQILSMDINKNNFDESQKFYLNQLASAPETRKNPVKISKDLLKNIDRLNQPTK